MKNIVFRGLTPLNMADIHQPARLEGVRCQKIISHVLYTLLVGLFKEAVNGSDYE
jgi:hypothetical protein